MALDFFQNFPNFNLQIVYFDRKIEFGDSIREAFRKWFRSIARSDVVLDIHGRFFFLDSVKGNLEE